MATATKKTTVMPSIKDMMGSMQDFVECTLFDEPLPEGIPADPEPVVKGEPEWDEGAGEFIPPRTIPSIQL